MNKLLSKKFKIGAVAVAFVLAAAGSATAGSKPRGAKPADPQEIIRLFAGNTWLWSKGGLHTKADGTAQAVWEGNIGAGTWSVTSKGSLCRTLVWHWVGNGGKAGGDPKKKCNRHVVDKDGVIWQRHHEENNWYRLNPDAKIARGNKIKSKYRKNERAIARS